jgi:hypothetical protein
MSKEIVYWKQRNGELISVDNMDINHLRNTLKLIIKNKNILKTALNEKLEKEKHIKAANDFVLRGDIAESFNNDRENEELEEDLGYQFNDDECRGNQW